MNSLSKWWNTSSPFEDYEEINQFCNHNKCEQASDSDWNALTEELKKCIPLGYTLNNHTLYVEKSATALIDKLFDKYIDDDTLLITSVVEHEAVDNNVIRYNRENTENHVKLHFVNGIKSISLEQVKRALFNHKYKRAFIYIIGTQITTGEITPQAFYEELRAYLVNKGIEPIMVIDDVHGMYMVPRDYSIFDYVICTSHAMIRRYDMGIMWSKTKEEFGVHNPYWLGTYITLLKKVLSKKDKLECFSQVMKEEFIKYLHKPYFEYISDSVPHIFSIRVDCPPRYIYTENTWKEFADKEVRLEIRNPKIDNIFYIRMRGSQYLTFPEMFEPAIQLVKGLLEKIMLFKEEDELE